MKPTDAEVDGLVAEFDTSGATKRSKAVTELAQHVCMIRLCSCCRPLSPFSQWTGKGEFTKEDFVQMMVRQTQTSEAELIKESFKVSHWFVWSSH